MADPSLVLGSFNMTDPNGTAWGTRVLAGGTSRGAPVPLETTINTFLQDGSIVVTQGYDNRETNIRVRFYGDDLTELANAEAALFAELGKPNTLTWTPPNGPVSVFSVITSSLTEDETDDGGEGQSKPWRTYNVRLVCEAFVQSNASITAPTLPASGTTTTLVDNGSATTNWTGTTNGSGATVAVVSGAVGVTTASLAGAVTIALTRTASITTSSTKFLEVDWKAATATPGATIKAYGDGVLLAFMGSKASPTAGYTRSYFYVPASSIAALRLECVSEPPKVNGPGGSAPGAAVVRTFHVDNINRTDIRPSVGTGRQSVRAFSVAGSAPSPGVISVEHASSSLGDALVYCWPTGRNGYSPSLRQYRVSGGTVTADSAMVSGSREQFGAGTPPIFQIPVNFLLPGKHLLVGRMRGNPGTSSGVPLNCTATTIINSVDIGPSVTFSSFAKALPPTVFQLYAMGTVILPTRDLDPATSAVVQIALTFASPDSVDYDDFWLFNIDIGQLVQVSCGTASPSSGGSSSRLFISPPTVDRPRPSVRIGTLADRSDSFQAAMSSWMFPEFAPPEVNIFTVTTNALDANVSLQHVPHWHTHAAS